MSRTPSRKSPQARPKRTRGRWHLLRWLLIFVVVVTAGWFAWLYRQIEATATIDNARPADAIAVFGAAEYRGRPSPVLHARLDKAVSLYDRKIAPVVITLGGGADKNSGLSEGGVGRDYLLANGVPYDRIIAETESFDTEEQVQRLASIAAEHRYHTLVVVSDGTHLCRIALLCRRAGLQVYTSPRSPLGHIDELDSAARVWHEMLSYTFLRFKVPVSSVRRSIEAK